MPLQTYTVVLRRIPGLRFPLEHGLTEMQATKLIYDEVYRLTRVEHFTATRLKPGHWRLQKHIGGFLNRRTVVYELYAEQVTVSALN